MVKSAFFKNESNGFILFMSVIIFLGCFALFFALSLIAAVPLFQIPFTELVVRLQDGTNPNNLNLIRYFQVVQSLGMFIVPAMFIGFLVQRSPLGYLQLDKKIDSQLIVLTVFTVFTFLPFVNLLAYTNESMKLPGFLSGVEQWMQDKEGMAEELTQSFLGVQSYKGLFFNLFMIAALPAIGEEMAFRGVLQKQLVKITGSKHIGVLLASIIFSAIHLQFYGFLPRLVLGLFLGYLFVWSGNLWYSIIAHFVNNALAVIVFFIVNKNNSPSEIESFGGTQETVYYAILSFILAAGLVYLFYRITRVNQEKG